MSAGRCPFRKLVALESELTRADLLYLFCTCTRAFYRFLPIETIEFAKSFENSRIVADRLPPPWSRAACCTFSRTPASCEVCHAIAPKERRRTRYARIVVGGVASQVGFGLRPCRTWSTPVEGHRSHHHSEHGRETSDGSFYVGHTDNLDL